MTNEIAVVSPASGSIVKVFQKPSESEILRIMESARGVSLSWAATKLPVRIALFRRLLENILKDTDSIVKTITECTGKTPSEALISDIYPSMAMLKYYIRRAPEILKTKKRKTPSIYGGSCSYVEYRPYGAVLVISPWNLPFQLSIVPVISAVLAGNSVILKPSEFTLTVGEIIAELFKKSGFPEKLVQVACGDGETGQKLIEAKPAKIFFTGSVATGAKVMAAASAEVIPVELELGGKDPMIAFEDANLERAANAAVYGAFANAGQLCVSVERLYVRDTVHDKFISMLEDKVKKLKIGFDRDSDIGAVSVARQLEIIKAHVADAVQKGAKLHGELKIEKNLVYPLIISNVNHSMKIMQEETFGPVLPVMRFKTEDEAVKLANDTIYGLNASVWTKDLEKAKRVASRIDSGNLAVNDVLWNIGNPDLPFGGVKKSGFGRYHAEDGLYAFSKAVSVMANPGKKENSVNWFPYGRLYEGLKLFNSVEFGRMPLIIKAIKLIMVLPKVGKLTRKK